eukprot:4296611-Pyramimonas_sp.AAC.1
MRAHTCVYTTPIRTQASIFIQLSAAIGIGAALQRSNTRRPARIKISCALDPSTLPRFTLALSPPYSGSANALIATYPSAFGGVCTTSGPHGKQHSEEALRLAY